MLAVLRFCSAVGCLVQSRAAKCSKSAEDQLLKQPRDQSTVRARMHRIVAPITSLGIHTPSSAIAVLHTGFVLEGFDLRPGCESQREVIQTITQLLPEEKLRVIHGVCKPGTYQREKLLLTSAIVGLHGSINNLICRSSGCYC